MTRISEHVATSFIISAFVHPHLFITPDDKGRLGCVVYRNARALLTGDVDYVEIDECNAMLIHYKNGGMYKSGDIIGVAVNSSRALEAVLDSRVKIIVRRNDGASMVLNECEEYKECVAYADAAEMTL